MDPDRLRKIPVFADLDDDELGHVAALAAEASVPDGEELVREGVRATSPMLLVTLTGWDVRRLRKSAPNAVEHLRGVVMQRREHA
jgi:CRP/FNR family transcriptional regulator, cyclic AMP receptor protein